MKEIITYAFCAVLLVAGFFALQAVSESSLPLWQGTGAIAAIILVMSVPVRRVNKLLNKEDAR